MSAYHVVWQILFSSLKLVQRIQLGVVRHPDEFARNVEHDLILLVSI